MNITLDGALTWLIAAAAIIWIGFGCYLAFLALKQRRLAAHIRQLERLNNERV